MERQSEHRWGVAAGVPDELCLVGAILLACFMSLERWEKKEYTSPFQWEAWSKNILCLIIPTKSLLKVGGQGGAWQGFSSAVVQREMTSYFELPICPERGPFLRHHTFPRVFRYYLLLYCRGNFCLYMPIQAAVHTTQPNISHWGGLRYLHVLVATTVRGTLGYLNESSSSHTC